MDKIVMLKGTDKVRKRVCVVFGAKGNEGATNAIKMLLDIFITEAKLGFSRGIDLKIHKDNSVSIRSYDDGFILDETIDEGKPIFEKVFCELYAEDRYIDDYYGFLGEKHNRLYGRNDTDLSFKTEKDHQHNLCCVQYASRFMRVEATRDGIKKFVEFKDGCLANEMRKENFQEESNTFIHFQLEDEVFEEKVAVFTKDIEDYLKCAAIAIPNLKCKIQDERCNNEVVYQYQ
ncbi:MAG: hypothetical protein IIU65_06465, partial [Clostridia bacterium]|nr:hypothetical protein [Clostridia bacterium]